jgi:hypothetical protein
MALPLTIHSANDTRDISQWRGESDQDTQMIVVPLVALIAEEANSVPQRCVVAIQDPLLVIVPPVVHSIREAEEPSRRHCSVLEHRQTTTLPHATRHG